MPPIDIFQVYDDSSIPGADDPPEADKLPDPAGSGIIRLKPTFKKNPAAGKPVSYAQICLKSQFHRKKSILTIGRYNFCG